MRACVHVAVFYTYVCVCVHSLAKAVVREQQQLHTQQGERHACRSRFLPLHLKK